MDDDMTRDVLRALPGGGWKIIVSYSDTELLRTIERVVGWSELRADDGSGTGMYEPLTSEFSAATGWVRATPAEYVVHVFHEADGPPSDDEIKKMCSDFLAQRAREKKEYQDRTSP